MSKLIERLKKLETVSAETSELPKLVLWRELDGRYSFGGQQWGSVEEILLAHPGKYNPDNVISFSWKRAAQGEA